MNPHDLLVEAWRNVSSGTNVVTGTARLLADDEHAAADAVMKRILAVLASPSPASGQAEPRAGSRLAKPVEETASDPLAILSKREREVLEGLVEGLANKAIAFRLGISQRTVEVHRANIMRRLGVGSFAELIRLAIMAGSGRPDPLH